MTTSNYNPIPDSPGSLSHRYICYRTKPLGWQQIGYITLYMNAASPANLPSYPDTTWVADPKHQYTWGEVYPVDASS